MSIAMSHWEATHGKTTYYVQIQGGQLVIGQHAGSGHTDNAGVASFESVRNGDWDRHIEQHFGSEVLTEIRAAVGKPTKPKSSSPRGAVGYQGSDEEFD